MFDIEKTIKGLEELHIVFQSDMTLHPKDFIRKHDADIIADALALLKAQEQEVVNLQTKVVNLTTSKEVTLWHG